MPNGRVHYDVRWHGPSSAMIGHHLYDDREKALALAYERLQLPTVTTVVIWVASSQWLILEKTENVLAPLEKMSRSAAY